MANDNQYKVALLNLGWKESRGIASILGMAVGDALGAST